MWPAFFGVLAFLPVFISASPVAFVRNDTSSLETDAMRLFGASVDMATKFLGVALNRINSSSIAFDPLQKAQLAIQNVQSFAAFNQILNDMNCSYDFTQVNLIPDPGPDHDRNLLASASWTDILVKTSAHAILGNATALGLSKEDQQTIRNASDVADTLATMLLPLGNLSSNYANELLSLAIWEVSNVIGTAAPKCTKNPTNSSLTMPGIAISGLNFLILSPNETANLASFCPKGLDDPNCFCQSISPNTSRALISPPGECLAIDGPGMGAMFLTTRNESLSLDPNNRTAQALSGLISAGPFSMTFNPPS